MMRNTPSFFGEFNTHKPKCSTTRLPAPELKIEKEASLREKRKQILQRLKQKTDQENITEVAALTHQIPTQIDGISDKVIFSPRTAKRFQQAASQRREITYSDDEITRPSDRDAMPTILLQRAEEHRTTSEEEPVSKVENRTRIKEQNERVRPKYVPSFTKQLPLRKLQENPNLSLSEKTESSHGTLRHLGYETPNLQKKLKLGRNANSLGITTDRNAYLDKFNTKKPPLISSNSLDVSDNNDSSSPLKRSASFHSLKDRQARLNTGREQFLDVNNSRSTKTASLPSVRLQNSSSLTPLKPDTTSFSSTKNLKVQQDKLEEDFHRLEEDLDRAFSELRNYLKTG